MIDTRSQKGPTRRALIWIQPARAIVVYALFLVMGAAIVLGAVGYSHLIDRTNAVCGPLRSGQDLAGQATSATGKGLANTFGAAADKLQCPKDVGK